MNFEAFEAVACTAAETRTLAGTAGRDAVARFLAETHQPDALTLLARAAATRLAATTYLSTRTAPADHQTAAGPPDHPAAAGPVVPRGPSTLRLLAAA